MNLKTFINLGVSLVSTSVIVRNLGSDAFAQIAVVLSFLAVFSLFGNALVDACIKSVAKDKDTDEGAKISEYLSTVFLVLIGLLLATAVIVSFLSYSGIKLIDIQFQFLFLMLFALVAFGNLVSGVFRVGAFVSENFALDSFIISVSRITYLILLVVGMLFSSNLWIVPIASLLAVSVLVTLMYLNFKNHLPNVSLNVLKARKSAIPEIGSSVGFMLLVYLGIYLTSNLTIILAKMFNVDSKTLFLIALATSIGGMVSTILTSFTYIGIPKIHSRLKDGSIESAVIIVQKLASIIILCLLWGINLLRVEGAYILDLWLGVLLNEEEVLIIMASVLSFGVSTLGILVSHFCSGSNLIKQYGLICLFEGVAVGLSVYITLSLLPDYYAALVILALPTAFYLIKFTYVKFFISKTYCFYFSEVFQVVIRVLCLFLLMLIMQYTFRDHDVLRLVLEFLLSSTFCIIIIKSIKSIS